MQDKFPTKGSLNVNLTATVTNVSTDHEAPEYLELTLNVRTGTTANTFAIPARYETSQEPAVDTLYAVIGELFYDPGQRWTSGANCSRTTTYVLIDSLQEVTTDLSEESTLPLFEIFGEVGASGSGEATIRYRVFDGYEHATYSQNVKVCYEEKLAAQVSDGQRLVGRGILHSLDRLMLQQIARPVKVALPY